MKRIILPTDFSDNSWRAMSYAAQLYRSIPCVFYLLNTFSVTYSQMEVGAIQRIEPLRRDSEKGLEEILMRFKELDHHSGTQIKTISKFAALSDAIGQIEKMDGEKYTIVMGTKGANGLGEWFLGTMTSHVISQTQSPVICVPNVAQLELPKRIMLAVDKDGVDRREEIEPLLEIATRHKAEVDIVNIPDGEETILHEDASEQFLINHYLHGIEHSCHTLNATYKEDGLVRFADSNKIDLIAMIKRDRGFWKNLFHKSLTKSMSFHCTIPLLVLKE